MNIISNTCAHLNTFILIGLHSAYVCVWCLFTFIYTLHLCLPGVMKLTVFQNENNTGKRH